MSRNVVVGAVIFGLVLAGLSVGIATFVSAQGIEAQAELQADKIAGVEEEIAASEQKIAGGMQALLPAAGGIAENLSSEGFLWSRGRLVVTYPEADESISFEVEPGADGNVKILSPLTVASDAVLADLSAGVATVNQVVVRYGMRDEADAWVVDPAGNIEVSGDFSGERLMVTGDFQAGGGKLRYDSVNDRLLVEGRIVATHFEGGDDAAMVFAHSVQFGGRVFAGSGAWAIEQDGHATFRNATTAGLATKALTAQTINSSTRPWWVASGGDARFGTLKGRAGVFEGAVTSRSLATTGAVAAGGAITGESFGLKGATPAFTVTPGGVLTASQIHGGSAQISGAPGSDVLVVHGDIQSSGDIRSTGALELGGRLTVADEVWADGFQLNNTQFAVDNSGMIRGTSVTAGSIDSTGAIRGVSLTADSGNIAGDLDVAGKITGTFAGTFDIEETNIVARDLHARGALRAGPSAPWRFEVTSAGTRIGGSLTVAGAATFADGLEVTGDVRVGERLYVSGTRVDPAGIPAFFRSGVLSVGPGGSATVSIPGMQATDSVVVTPRFLPTAFHYVTVSDGGFSIYGDAGNYSWIVSR